MIKGVLRTLSILTAVVLPSSLWAWTTPISVSDADTSLIASNARIAKGSGGSIHLAYRIKTNSNQWYIRYRFRNGTGSWGGIETISTPWSDRPDVVEDSQGRPHIIYTGTGAGGYNDLFHAVKTNGSWSVSNITNTSNLGEDYARLVVDSQGQVHMIFFKTTDLTYNNVGDVYYRVWSNGSWTADTYLGDINYKVGYAKPDIAIDPADNIHVVWQPDQYTMVYRKKSGGVWQLPVTIGTTSAFFSYPRITAINQNSIAVVTFDQVSGSSYQLKWTYSTNGGTSWSGLQYLNDGHYPSLRSANGKAYLVYQGRPATGNIGYREWNGSSWTNSVFITPATNWQQLADVTVGTDGIVHVVYDDTLVSGQNARISYTANVVDTTPPSPVSGFVALTGNGKIKLDWTNPSDGDFTGTMVRYKTTGYPTSRTDGFQACNNANTPGSSDSYIHSGLTNGTTYYYTAFAYDAGGNFSSGVNLIAAPSAPPKPNLLNNGVMDSFSGGSASGWTSYKLNDPNGAISFNSDTTNVISGSSQGIFGIDGAGLPSSGLTAAGLYQVVSGVTPGKVYQLVGYQDIFSSSYNSSGRRYLHNFGINSGGGTNPGGAVLDGTIGGCKWMTASQALWNDISGSSPFHSGYHWATAAYPATSNTLSAWTGLTIYNAAERDGVTTKFNTDNLSLFEWDFPVNSGLVNGDFEGSRINLQDGLDPSNMTDGTTVIPSDWVPCGGAIGQAVYNNWTCLPEAKRSGALGFEMKSRRGTINAGIMQKITCSYGYTQTFSAWVRTSGQDSTLAYVGIDPYGGGDITSPNIRWQSTSSTTWTQLSISATSMSTAVTVFLKTYNTNAAIGSYHWSYFDDCSYTQGARILISLSEAKELPDSTPVSIGDCVVTAVYNGFFYIEKTDRSSGIRINYATTANIGDTVTVRGYMGTVAGERCIVR